jgi:hypothetical protein
VDDEVVDRITDLGMFVSFMRARPSKVQDETEPVKELSYRLVNQFTRLAACLAVVLNRPSPDGEVMRRTARTALDTAEGKTLKITAALHAAGEKGAEAAWVAQETVDNEPSTRELLKFLVQIGVAERFPYYPPSQIKAGLFDEPVPTGRPKTHWRLTPDLRELYSRVYGLSSREEETP